MFTKSAAFYDAIYSWKDYAAEAAQLGDLIEQNKRSPGKTLLDVACGTGQHLRYLNEVYQGEGLDLDSELLKIARERCPGVTFHQGDMVDFNLRKQYDVVTCLFSSIGYAKTVERLNSALRSIAHHLVTGGVAIVEPWLMPGQYIPKHVAARFVDLPDLKIARINTAELEGDVSILAFEYLIGTPEGVVHLSERHELTLFSDAQYRAAFQGAGLSVELATPGLDGRGLYIGVKA
ncbi:MAG TPA: class I SAM-dependent methyltransferase [Phototrophicaceae bacterium]|nr:class I SAM-dependent methyltransferase [Phototrophicaceae bacterium]